MATLVYAVYEIRKCFGRAKRLFGSLIPKIIRDEMVQIVQICTHLDYPSEKKFLLLLLKLYLLMLFVCSSLVFYIQRHELCIKGVTFNRIHF